MNNRGAIAMMSAILAVPLLLFVGLSLDASLLWLLQQRMQWAVDSAALLGASQTNGELPALVTKDAKELFWASYGASSTSYLSGQQNGFLGSSSAGATVTTATAATGTTPSNPYVTVTATATLPTALMKIVGQSLSTVTVTGQAAVPHKVEMTLVLDNSLSMGLPISNTIKIAALQTAANNMLTTILGNGASPSPNVSIGIVPFAGAVNVGNDAIGQSFLKPGTLAKFPGAPGSSLGWRGCVQARAYAPPANSYDITEDSPSSRPFDPYLYASTSAAHSKNVTGDNDWTLSNVNDTSTYSQSANTNSFTPTSPLYYGPNLFCPMAALVKLTNNRAALSNAINAMTIVNGGGTIMIQGLQWGWLALSPLWQTAWGLPPSPTGAARPAAYTDTGTTKIVVMMTDGVNEVDGIDTWYGAAATAYADEHSNCERMQNTYPGCNGVAQADHPDSWYTSYGRISSGVLGLTPALGPDGDGLRNQANAKLRTRFQNLCTAMKAKGVIVYTIFFHGSTDDQILHATANGAGTDLQSCATDANHYFDSQSATAINAAFQKIAQDINDLRVTQ